MTSSRSGLGGVAAWRLISLALLLVVACKSKSKPVQDDASVAILRDAGVDAGMAASTDWPELADYPRVDAVRTITIPSTKPAGDLGGLVIAGDLAIVSSSQFGFAAVDIERGGIAWTKPAGARVAPPLVHGASLVLVGDCPRYEPVPDGETLLGCLRVVTPAGSDEAVLAIHGRGVEAFADARGRQALWDAGERLVRWKIGDAAIVIDLITGVAKPASAEPPPLVVVYRGKRWEITQRDGRIVARGKPSWETEHSYTALVGVVWTADGAPLVRIANLRAFAGEPEVSLHDMDATGSLRAAFARPVPGVALRGYGVSAQGDAAIAAGLDDRRDVIAAYAANALLMYVHALPPPRVPRLSIGVAVADRAVVVFHDGDQVTILPELLAPPTAPGATRGSSKNPTP